ncbi:serine threonine kinase [Brachionus plicatilis]|uniref:Serine threonine kinase n=1 Tax=Brachionus plicatilis TaxID=10195 RepID=A0A3M7RPL4_BRAPC|nr:serine threonine kinase [Brachionus plicatilis]
MNKNDEFDVFISYNWGIKDKVVKLHENLKNKNLRVWRDDTEIKNNNSPLTEQLAFAIKRSKIILCCMTKKYSDSKNCRLEFQYANDINKTLLILFIDKLKIEELNDSIGFLMSGLVRINCYNNPDNWNDEQFDEILKSINANLEDLDKKNQVDDETIKGQYKLIEKIGEGAEAVVFKIHDLNDKISKYKALKQFKNVNISNNRLIEKEVELMKIVNNQNIIKYLDFFHEKWKHNTIYYILTDYYEDGTLDEEIALQRAIGKPLAFHDIISWSIQLLNGIQYLHNHDEQIIHRDIKPANIFLSGRKLVLGDLGHAKRLAQISKTSRNFNFGTDNYIAPEILDSSGIYTQKVDIWSYGCVLYEMIKLEKLFDGKNQRDTEKKIEKFNNNDLVSRLINSKVSPTLVNVLKFTLVNNPRERLAANQIENILKGENFSTIVNKNDENAEIIEIKKINSDSNKTELKNFENAKSSYIKYCRSGSSDNTIKISNKNNSICINTLNGHTKGVNCLQLIDKNTLASGSYDHSIKIWNLNNSESIKTLNGHTSGVMCLQLIDKNTLASGSMDKTIKIWNLKNSECINTLNGHTYYVKCLQLIDKNTLASGSYDKTIKIWNLNNSECINTLKGHTKDVHCLQLIDKNTIASGSDDKTIKIWNINNTECLKTLNGHTYYVTCLQLIDKNTLASGSVDKTIKIWNLNNSECINTLNGHTADIGCLQIIDKNTLSSGSNDKTIKIWNLNNSELTLEFSAKKKFIEEEEDEDDHMEIDVEPDINDNYNDFFTSSEFEESENEDFYQEEEMVTIDILLITQIVDFIQTNKPTERWISVLIYSVLR